MCDSRDMTLTAITRIIIMDFMLQILLGAKTKSRNKAVVFIYALIVIQVKQDPFKLAK